MSKTQVKAAPHLPSPSRERATSRSSRAASANGLPSTDPGFRYSESKNIYAKKLEEVRGKVFSDHEAEAFAGHWRDKFSLKPSPQELNLEIGCNAGHVVVEWAAQNPAHGFIGLDWKFKPIFWGVEKIIKRNLNNLIFFRGHAERVRFMFAEGELDRVSIFFPDPWPKKKQMKNRWINSDRLRDIHHVLRAGGVLHIKTDHPEYFEWIEKCQLETAALWEIENQTRDLHAGNALAGKLMIPEVTLFERLFIKDGLPIHQLILKARKPSKPANLQDL